MSCYLLHVHALSLSTAFSQVCPPTLLGIFYMLFLSLEDVSLPRFAMAESETSVITTFEMYRTLISEVNALEIQMQHEIEKRNYLEQVLTVLVLTTMNNQEEVTGSGIPALLGTMKTKICSLVSNCMYIVHVQYIIIVQYTVHVHVYCLNNNTDNSSQRQEIKIEKRI